MYINLQVMHTVTKHIENQTFYLAPVSRIVLCYPQSRYCITNVLLHLLQFTTDVHSIAALYFHHTDTSVVGLLVVVF